MKQLRTLADRETRVRGGLTVSARSGCSRATSAGWASIGASRSLSEHKPILGRDPTERLNFTTDTPLNPTYRVPGLSVVRRCRVLDLPAAHRHGCFTGCSADHTSRRRRCRVHRIHNRPGHRFCCRRIPEEHFARAMRFQRRIRMSHVLTRFQLCAFILRLMPGFTRCRRNRRPCHARRSAGAPRRAMRPLEARIRSTPTARRFGRSH